MNNIISSNTYITNLVGKGATATYTLVVVTTFSVLSDDLTTSGPVIIQVQSFPNLVSDGTGQKATQAALSAITDDSLTAFAVSQMETPITETTPPIKNNPPAVT